MQQASRGGPRRLVSPLPSPAASQADSTFSVSRYATQRQTPRGLDPEDQTFPSLRAQGSDAPVNGSRMGPSNFTNNIAASAPSPDDSRLLDEVLAKTHWDIFRSYLSEGRGQTHARQNKAREKLTRLSRTQFSELSTDVYDEVQRRSNDSLNSLAFLPPNPRFHPKRNQAREKLASLQTSRLKDLTSDVFFEIERRFPTVAMSTDEYKRSTISSQHSLPSRTTSGTDDIAAPLDRDLAKPGRQNNGAYRQTAVIPNKSVMIEEDNESDYESDPKSPRIESDYASVKSVEYANRSGSKPTSTTLSTSRHSENSDHQWRVSELQEKIKQLELDLKEKSIDPPLSRQMKREMEELLERNDKLEEENVTLKASQSLESSEVGNLKAENKRLKAELEEQQQITEEVRLEAQGFLDEMRGLSERETAVYERAASLENQVATLEAETREWKERYQKTQTQLRKLKATSQFFSPNPQNAIERTFVSPDGIIRDIAIVKFQVAIDSLLSNSRNNISALMDSMKDVVVAIRSVQMDLDASSSAPIMSDNRVTKLRQKMSTTINNLMTAVKNHVSGGSLSPVSLVDAAASHLSNAVIELSKICKLKVTPSDFPHDLEQDQPAISYGKDDPKVSSKAGCYSGTGPLISPPSSVRISNGKRAGSSFHGKDLGIQTSNADPERSVNEELRVFLEGQTEGIVSSIQKLLSAIRADARPQVLQAHMGEIVTIVGLVSSTMREAFLTSLTLRSQAGKVVDGLDACTSRIRDMENSAAMITDQQATKEFKQKLAGVAFDTAKQTKELSIILQNVDDEVVDLT